MNQIRVELPKIKLERDERPFLQCLIEFSDTTAGRDRLCRISQYFIKFLLPFIKPSIKLSLLTTFLENYGALMSLTRRVFRIGRYFAAINNVSNRIRNSKEYDLSTILKCLADISGGLYLLVDHIILFDKIKSINLTPQISSRVDFIGSLFWMVETCSNIFYQIIDLNAVNNQYFTNEKKMQGLNDCYTDEYKDLYILKDKLNTEHFKKSIDILRCLADIPVLVHFLTSDKTVSNSACGFFGVISSSIGIYQKFYK